ncbi:MAG: M15 family metallopeptidase [Elusimicrobia bacterium]|nr:M15 family metallopeptidase [Elusimicrobiota bacterium]
MPSFSKKSLEILNTCNEDLQKVLKEAIKVTDFTVLCGHRGEKEQNQAFENGTSKLKYPGSRRNKIPSEAADCAPWPVSWDPKDECRFYFMAGIILAAAKYLGKQVVWGGSWQGFKDLPHFELKKMGGDSNA